MPGLPKLIDNKRHKLADLLIDIAPNHDHLSIATGYWDLPGIMRIIDKIHEYKSIRIIIGQEPLAPRYARILKKTKPDNDFPELDFAYDLALPDNVKQADNLRLTIIKIKRLISNGVMAVKVYRKEFLHAKAYIFGNYADTEAVGFVGSSNFTGKGLTENRELNALESDHRIIRYKPVSAEDSHGHLSWFDEVWNEAELWNGKFTQTLEQSPVGDLTFGAYDVYIKTLMEVFPDELIPKMKLDGDIADVLYSFQNRNAGILINKLEKMGVAMLSDSVGLGKTITAGAVIKHYIENGAKRIIVITPASLKNQWIEDLADRLKLIKGVDFEIVSQQNTDEMKNLSKLDRYKNVDLFVVDEAHNLRNQNSTRYDAILDWFINNIESKVLLLTATPINNSLMDFANQIQLGLKGSLDSVGVPYLRNDKKLEVVDFFEALKRIQGEVRQAEKSGTTLDWKTYKSAFTKGLSHYLVRSTRQGVEAEGGIIDKDGKKHSFPKSIVEKIEHKNLASCIKIVDDAIKNALPKTLENIDVRFLDLNVLASLTQQSLHPLDFIKEAKEDTSYLKNQFGLNDEERDDLFLSTPNIGVVPNIFALMNMLGFTPYRPLVYEHRFYGKSAQQIRDLGLKGDEAKKISIQFVVHNILHITWLKRLESSSAALLKSIEYYIKRIALFEKYLNKGYIVSLGDALTLESDEYGEDVERAFTDYNEYLHDIELALENGEDKDAIKKRGVERIELDAKKYNVTQLKLDVLRDKEIANLLMSILSSLITPELDDKLKRIAGFMQDKISENKFGKKILVFSYFADTIHYLKEALPHTINMPDFDKKSAFITGGSSLANDIASRFAPIAKKHEWKTGETEIDFLFATDVLSEGQNLQDAAILINYDLHWNPVRMIQRNGRINRLNSNFENVLVGNATPSDNLELYLKLVKRLQTKIETIRNTIGTDQSVLGEKENPIEFIEKFYNSSTSSAADLLKKLEDDSDILNWSDDFCADLRTFLANADETEIERIKNIPLGKWNYLPKKTRDSELFGKKTEFVLALTRVHGTTSITGTDIADTYFMKIEPKGNYPVEFIESVEALSLIKTTPDNNITLQDKIDVDREKVARRAIRQALTKAQSTESKYTFKPSQERALEILQKSFPSGADLIGTLRNGIKNSRQERELKRILLKVYKELKEKGSVYVSTINEFVKFYKEIENIQNEERNIESAEGVLYYAAE
jgi:ERCC4-related helicase